MDYIALSTLSGSVLSLFFSYIPGLKEWFGLLDGQKKSLITLCALVLTTAGMYAISCTGIYNVGVSCDKIGLVELVKVFFAALVANQGTYLATKKL